MLIVEFVSGGSVPSASHYHPYLTNSFFTTAMELQARFLQGHRSFNFFGDN